MLRNVYVRADVPDTIELRAAAASLVHPFGIISDRFAAWIHGVDVIVVDKDSFTDEALYAWLGELREALRLAA